MASTVAIDLGQVCQSLGLAGPRVQTVIDLLDAGNTVPFITRYRKDQTGGLDEEQIRQIQARVVKLRLLAERKQTILRSIESQGKLTPELAASIEAADTAKRLEDLYLPFKPKKQTLGAAARERGLEPLALEILRADPACADLDARARDYVNTDRKVATAADALLGAGHILAEMFSERADLRGRLRGILEQSGKLTSTAVEPESDATVEEPAPAAPRSERPAPLEPIATPEPIAAEEPTVPSDAAAPPPSESPASAELSSELAAQVEPLSQAEAAPLAMPVSEAEAPAEAIPPSTEAAAAAEATAAAAAQPAVVHDVSPDLQFGKRLKKKKKKKDAPKDKKAEHKAFRDYFKYSEALSKIPPHRILAINRGERAKALRVKVEADLEAMYRVVDELLVPEGHPHADFLRGCAHDALGRLVLPSLEREFRRELTDRAESHAVQVFARNLRNLLLQSPVRDRRVLAIDPAFKSGCKLVALDEFGQLLDHGLVHIIGKEERRAEAGKKAVEMVREHQLSVVAIGNGTACRETERWISDLIAGELAEQNVAYVIVNEAGASVYSASRLGREEFPQYDATLRGAISIGRRLQDPLSELVKIDAASIGVGMYQHDVKAKHLRESLDGVVASCVNYVGVDLNTASPALLKYVSGLNQLTAQRVFDYRTAHGPFKSREELKSVQGFGEAAFVQAAGFLKIALGANPLDATWIHPESYDLARQTLAKLEATPEDLADGQRAAQVAERVTKLDLEELARQLQAGALTLADIAAQLARPGRDPRENLPQPIFKHGILKLDDLAPGLELMGTVLNVVDFGAFVDIGLKDSGLVHVSQLANKFVQDPHDVVSVGDIVRVWVREVEKERRRVSLTMIKPGTRRQSEPRPAPSGGGRPPREGQPSRPRRPARPPVKTDRPPAGGPKPKFHTPSPSKPKPKPRPVVPLTEAMKKGKAPLRTFGDLKQFWAMKEEAPGEEQARSDS
ncbi:MAG TPA: Tex-like N-terminal domain-containing protein [Pirellulales bacterium]|nr:Tex-like N-terminal domain-containing protein [Pirellulales bacterium]